MIYDPYVDTLCDPAIQDTLVQLNKLGVPTLQSCDGHEEGETRKASGETFWSDSLIWFDGRLPLWSDEFCLSLVDLEGIEFVSRLYGRESFPVVEVTFPLKQRELGWQNLINCIRYDGHLNTDR